MKKFAIVMTFDSNYVAKAIVAYRSLMKFYKDFDLYAFCFDDLAYEIVRKMKRKNIIAVPYKDFENKDLLKIKEGKKRYYEYYWACIPYLTQEVMKTNKYKFAIYADADIMFFSDPGELFRIQKNVDVMIQPNNFSANEVWQFGPVGYYCSGWVVFRNNKNGRRVLRYWVNKCLEWCYARFEDNKFGDQKYLDNWKQKFRNVAEILELGASVAPWNIAKYEISKRGNTPYLNGKCKLIYYHYHSFRMSLSNYKYIITGDRNNKYEISTEVKDMIYKPYIKEMISVIDELKKNDNYLQYTKINPEGIYKVKE